MGDGEECRLEDQDPRLRLVVTIVWGDKVFVTTANPTGSRSHPALLAWEVPEVEVPKVDLPAVRSRRWIRPRTTGPERGLSLADLLPERRKWRGGWKQTAAEKRPSIPKSPSNTYATETPVTHGERVYAYFGMTGVFCYDLAGQFLWKADLGSYSMGMGHGTASSPVLDGGRLFIQCDNEENSFLVALDGKTGKELWRTPRTEGTSWSTPLVWKNKERTEVVCLGSPRSAPMIRPLESNSGNWAA